MFRATLAFAALAYASAAGAQSTSTTLDMGGGSTHVDTMGPNGTMSSSNCMDIGGGMTTCNTMDMSQPQRSHPTPDMSQRQSNGTALNFIGGLIARSRQRSFQRSLGEMLSRGDCQGAANFAFVNERYDVSDQIRRSCQPAPVASVAAPVAAPEEITMEEFMAGTPMPSAASAATPSSTMTLVSTRTIPNYRTSGNNSQNSDINTAAFDPNQPFQEVYRITGEESSTYNTEYNVSYLGHSFLLEGPSELSLEDIISVFEHLWRDNPWVEYSISRTGTRYSYNILSQRNISNMIEVWVKGDHSRDRTNRARTSNTLYEINCEAQTTRELQSAHYNPDGSILASYDKPYVTTRVIPDTIGSDLYSEMCSRSL